MSFKIGGPTARRACHRSGASQLPCVHNGTCGTPYFFRKDFDRKLLNKGTYN